VLILSGAMRVQNVSATKDDRIDINTSKGAKVHADVLIAADGSSSRLRALLRPKDGLEFAGPTCIYGTTELSYAPSGKKDELGLLFLDVGLCCLPLRWMQRRWFGVCQGALRATCSEETTHV
jgi:2-polyprenyl-6-methoxyphenol hydroxylase-like FAD-dependent oxidoreductase